MSVMGINPPADNAHGDELQGQPPMGPDPTETPVIKLPESYTVGGN